MSRDFSGGLKCAGACPDLPEGDSGLRRIYGRFLIESRHLAEFSLRRPTMNRLFVTVAAASLSAAALAATPRTPAARKAGQQTAQAAKPKQDGKAPMMVSPADMKWVALPERPGMQFALLSGDPKTGAYTQMRKVPAGTDNG